MAPHAPYSVSRELFQAIREEVTSSAEPITSVHVGESPEEVELLASGSGPWAQLLRRIGAWREGWVAPGLGPVEYLDQLGVIDARTLIVHGVQLGEDSLARLHERGATLVTCPRSNQWVGVGAPPIERFYLSGVPVAIGTDSLASVSDLNLFAEMKEMRWLAPGVPARRIIESATLIGARALGLDHRFGTLSTRQARRDCGGAASGRSGGRGRAPGRLASPLPPCRGHRATDLPRTPMSRLITYLSFVRFSHSVFALPFALTGALLATREHAITWVQVAWIVAAMVAARSAAMGFNRLVDARWDAMNPRTAMRELPRGAMSTTEATAFVIVSSVVFIAVSFQISALCGWLSPVALGIVFWYSLAKRYTAYTQAFLGLAMAVAPVGGWLAAGGRGGAEPWLLGLAIGLWVGGFDVLYACQDLEFDRAQGLRSIPVRFGVERSLLISRLMHVGTILCMAGLAWLVPLGAIYLAGVALVAALLIYEQSLVSATDLSQVKRAFDMNGYVGIVYFFVTALALYVG